MLESNIDLAWFKCGSVSFKAGSNLDRTRIQFSSSSAKIQIQTSIRLRLSLGPIQIKFGSNPDPAYVNARSQLGSNPA